jgi:hypothetical protein
MSFSPFFFLIKNRKAHFFSIVKSSQIFHLFAELLYIDEFCKFFLQEVDKHSVTIDGTKPLKARMTTSEIMTIMVYWHLSGFKNFKVYYVQHVQVHLRKDFPNLVSYSRFVELMKSVSLPLFVFAKFLNSECTGASFIDSTKLAVCNNRRIYSHKVFKGLADRGKTSMGWFFGFKLHIVTDEYGNVVDFTLSSGNVHDANKKVVDSITKKLYGILVGDKGYLGLFGHLFEQGIKLIHRLRSNMKNQLISLHEKTLLRKRGSIIETTIGILKDHLSLEHSRHRSPSNFLCHVFSSIISLFFFRAKNSLNDNLLTDF